VCTSDLKKKPQTQRSKRVTSGDLRDHGSKPTCPATDRKTSSKKLKNVVTDMKRNTIVLKKTKFPVFHPLVRLRIVRACQSSLSDPIHHFLKEEIKFHYLINKQNKPRIEFRAISDMLHCFMWLFTAPSSHVMMVQFHGCVKFRFIGEHDQFPRILHFRLLFTGSKSQFHIDDVCQ